MASIIDRLLDEAEKAQRKGHLLLAEVCRDASDQLGLVMEERDRMKKALQEIEDPPPMAFDFDDGCGVCAWMSNRAEDALKGDDQ